MPETKATRAGKCTPKEAKFARELVKTGVQRTAALRSYNTDKPRSADDIARKNLEKDRVRQEIDRITNAVNLKEINQDTWRAAIIDTAFTAKSENVRYKGRELGAKVWNLLDESPKVLQSVQFNDVNITTADAQTLSSALTQRLKLAGKVIDTRQEQAQDIPQSSPEPATATASPDTDTSLASSVQQ